MLTTCNRDGSLLAKSLRAAVPLAHIHINMTDGSVHKAQRLLGVKNKKYSLTNCLEARLLEERIQRQINEDWELAYRLQEHDKEREAQLSDGW